MGMSIPVSILVIAKYSTRYSLRTALMEQEYLVIEADTPNEGLSALSNHQVDVIIFEMSRSEKEGVIFTKQLRKATQIPIIILSHHRGETLIAETLDTGADDYIIVPYSMIELLARVRVAIRHRGLMPKDNLVEVGDLTMNLLNRTVTINGWDLPLTLTEYKLLYLLAHNINRVVTYEQLSTYALGAFDKDDSQGIGNLRTAMYNLRKKLIVKTLTSHDIVTRYKTGYILQSRIKEIT